MTDSTAPPDSAEKQGPPPPPKAPKCPPPEPRDRLPSLLAPILAEVVDSYESAADERRILTEQDLRVMAAMKLDGDKRRARIAKAARQKQAGQ